MGQRHDLRCSKCGYEIDAMLGIGMLYSPENIFTGQTPLLNELVDDQSTVKDALKRVKLGETIADDYGHALYACPKDFYLFEKFYFKIGSFEPKYHCQYCDTVLEQVTFAKGTAGTTKLKFIGQDKFWQCPRCGNDAMVETAFENWD